MDQRTPSSSSVTRLSGLVLIPVVLLAGIAVFGLVEYRHSITADAREEAESWASPKQAELTLGKMVVDMRELPMVRLYAEIPTGDEAESAEAKRLETATREQDLETLRALCASTERTPSGLDVRVLAAWRVLDLTGEFADAEQLAKLAIHEAPSAISAPVVQMLEERFPGNSDWLPAWHRSEEKRAILARHPDASGLVADRDGPVVLAEGKVLAHSEMRAFVRGLHGSADLPRWMQLDFVALGTSLVSPVEKPIVSAGSPLRIVVGIGDPALLYARYWRVVGWTTALIICALVSALVGIWLAQRALAREKRLGELKSQFVASVSHELRAPVASMRLMADALDAEKVTGEKAKEFHQLMSQEGARLSSLIENVLDFARIEEGRKEYRFADCDLSTLVRDTVMLMTPVANEREVSIESDIADLDEVPRLDSAAIEQALVNLVDNAIKFSPEGGTIKVSLAASDGEWRLSVADEGPGISKSDRVRVFERFTRLGNELRRETQGTGIGLSIVKHIVEAHGATIAIEDNEGGGAKFVARGPKRTAAEEESARTVEVARSNVETKRATS